MDELILSCYQGNNNIVFPKVLALHVPEGATIADVTWGKGVFWKDVDTTKYNILKSDLMDGIDFRSLPYDDETLDALVIDPPYLNNPSKNSNETFEKHYRNREMFGGYIGKDSHDILIKLYIDGAVEAKRVLKRRGILIVKCQDETFWHKQRLTHVELINSLERLDYKIKDLFVVMYNNTPMVKKIKKQNHARKNHSYFLVFIKK